MYSKYDDAILEMSDPLTSASRRINLAQKAQAITILEFDADPQNEAELSTYTVSFLPTNNIGFF